LIENIKLLAPAVVGQQRIIGLPAEVGAFDVALARHVHQDSLPLP
jgi:hypothetical protein